MLLVWTSETVYRPQSSDNTHFLECCVRMGTFSASLFWLLLRSHRKICNYWEALLKLVPTRESPEGHRSGSSSQMQASPTQIASRKCWTLLVVRLPCVFFNGVEWSIVLNIWMFSWLCVKALWRRSLLHTSFVLFPAFFCSFSCCKKTTTKICQSLTLASSIHKCLHAEVP